MLLLLFSFTLFSCNNYKSEEFIVEGNITSIDKENNYIYVSDQGPIIYRDHDKLKFGQKIKLELYSTSSEDIWDPKKIKIKSVEIID